MSFQPSVPLSGVGGWKLLQRTEARQREVFATSPQLARELEYFRANIAEADTAEKLVSDRRLLKVALGAFGLEDGINKGALIRKALEGGSESDSFAARLVDPKWKRFAKAFGYGDIFGTRVKREVFPNEITSAYKDRSFELAVGESDENLRLALNFRREIARHANGAAPDGFTWFEALGDRPVRAVLEKALGFPSSFGQLDIDRQRDDMRAKLDALVGDTSLAAFNDPEVVERVLTRFLARAEAENGPSATTRGAAALTLLNGAFGVGGGATAGLLLSNRR